MQSLEFVLFGGGGHGRAVTDVIERLGGRVVAVGDPNGSAWAGPHLVKSDEAALEIALQSNVPAVVAIGDNQRRATLVRSLLARGAVVPSVIARTATVSNAASLGPGTVVLEHAHVGSGARLGSGCIVNTGAVVEHDVELGDEVQVGPTAVLAGGARCGNQVTVGAGAVVLPEVRVGDRAVVGAGAVVLASVDHDAVVVGVPARPTGR